MKSKYREFLSRPGGRGGRQRWQEILPATDAWWRPFEREGEVGVLLAMRWTLAAQIGVGLPDVHDQASLTNLGRKFGALDPNPPEISRLSGGENPPLFAPAPTHELLP